MLFVYLLIYLFIYILVAYFKGGESKVWTILPLNVCLSCGTKIFKVLHALNIKCYFYAYFVSIIHSAFAYHVRHLAFASCIHLDGW